MIGTACLRWYRFWKWQAFGCILLCESVLSQIRVDLVPKNLTSGHGTYNIPNIPSDQADETPNEEPKDIINIERDRALLLICGVVLGIPLIMLTGYAAREFVLAMWEQYNLKAAQKEYSRRMSRAAQAYRDAYR